MDIFNTYILHSDPSTTNQTNTSDSTEPSIQTPSTGMLSTDSDHLFESQGSAIAVVTTLSVMVVILCITNALTAGYLCTRLPVFRRKTIPNATDAVLQLQEKGGIGAANSSFTEETIIANKGAGMLNSGRNISILILHKMTHLGKQFHSLCGVVLTHIIRLTAWFRSVLSL